MAQTPAKLVQHPGDHVDYTPAAAVTAGDVVVVGNKVYIAPTAIANGAQGALAGGGVWDVPKGNTVIAVTDTVSWRATGTPRSGDNDSGAAFNSSGTPMGQAQANAASNDTTVRVKLQDMAYLRPGATAVTAAGAAIGNATAIPAPSEGVFVVTTDNNDKGVQLPAAAPGRMVTLINFNAALTLKVYPPTAKQVNAAGANNATVQAVNTVKTYICEGTNAYYG